MGSISVTHHARAESAQGMGAALADVAVAADHGGFAGDHDIGGALEAVGERFAAAVDVVELRLGDRVVHIDGRDKELALLRHLVEAMDAGGGFLGDAFHSLTTRVNQPGRSFRTLLRRELITFLRGCRRGSPSIAGPFSIS
jgi:hypothetical protein